jgi:N-glycosylase/DNA lyase
LIPPKEVILKAISEVKPYIDQRIGQFKSLKEKGLTIFDFKPFADIKVSEADIFSETCFCILTANFKAETGIKIQTEVGIEGFRNYSLEELYNIFKKHGHRFAMQRAERIVNLRPLESFLQEIRYYDDGKKAREELVKKVKGYGYKEASHFLRNIGFEDVAIIDRHISRFLFENNLIKPRKTITKNVYLESESVLEKLCQELNLTQGELDLYIFYIKTKKVLK